MDKATLKKIREYKARLKAGRDPEIAAALIPLEEDSDETVTENGEVRS